VLSFLRVEHVSGRRPRSVRSASRVAEIDVVPTRGLRPPQLVDVVVDAPIEDVLGALQIEHVAVRPVDSVRSASRTAEIDVVPTRGLRPPHLMDVVVHAPIDDVLAFLRVEHVSGRPPRSVRSTTRTAEIDVVPTCGLRPPDLMDVVVDAPIDDVLAFLR